MTWLYIALIIVVFIIFWRIKRGRCGPRCQPPKTPQSKERLTYSERLKEIRKRIEQSKKKKGGKR